MSGKFISIVLLFYSLGVDAQKESGGVLMRMKSLHQSMVSDKSRIGNYIDDSLSYGHSNGWIENNKEFKEDLGGKITYHSFKEDSISIVVNKKVAHARFVADIDATLAGKRTLFHLRVLEVWVKRKSSWKLFARQAFK